MRQAFLINTTTYLNFKSLSQDIAVNFFGDKSFQNLESNSLETREQNWVHGINTGRIIEINANSKDDFQTKLGSFYKVYSQKVLIFLGDLSDYSIPLQESLLKFLEEPPDNLYLILFTRTTNNVLGTVLSRCTRINLSENYYMKNLDTELLTKIKEKLPVVSEYAKSLINEYPENILLPEVKEVERFELDFWLWQLNYYLEKVYIVKPNITVSNIIKKLSIVRDLNHKNLQKKLALNWLKIE